MPVRAVVQYGASPSCVHATVYRCQLAIDPYTGNPCWVCWSVVSV